MFGTEPTCQIPLGRSASKATIIVSGLFGSEDIVYAFRKWSPIAIQQYRKMVGGSPSTNGNAATKCPRQNLPD